MFKIYDKYKMKFNQKFKITTLFIMITMSLYFVNKTYRRVEIHYIIVAKIARVILSPIGVLLLWDFSQISYTSHYIFWFSFLMFRISCLSLKSLMHTRL